MGWPADAQRWFNSKGTVAKVFETRSVVILNMVLVSGKFVAFHGAAEIEVTQPGPIKRVR